MKLIFAALVFAGLFLSGEEVTKLQVGKPRMEAPAIAIPEIDALRLKAAQQSLVINQYQANEYWKMVQSLQARIKVDGERVQELTDKILADAKVDKKEYRVSEDGLRLEKITSPVARREGEK